MTPPPPDHPPFPPAGAPVPPADAPIPPANAAGPTADAHVPPAHAAESPSAGVPTEPTATLAPARPAGAAACGGLTPLCLRCRYDLSGAAAAWTTQCPLEGTCPECGGVVDFGKAYDAAARVPWAYDVPGVRGLALGKWWRTTARVLLPHRFWREMRHAPLAPGRLVLWLVCAVCTFHLVLVLLRLVRHTQQVAWNNRGGLPTRYWNDLDSSLRLILYPVYGGASRRPFGEPRLFFFAERATASVAVASLAATLLLVLNRITVRRAPYVNKPLLRAAVYGLIPLGLMYAVPIVTTSADLLSIGLNKPMKLWFGSWSPTGYQYGVQKWCERLFHMMCAVWLVVWWWHAAKAAYTGPRPTRIRIACVAVALATAAAMYTYYMSSWDAWRFL